MTFSRSHTGMVGIISLFTGMIAPVIGSGEVGYPFPLTDLQTITYIILFLLSFGFYLVSIQNWRSFRVISIVLIILIGYMLLMSMIGSVHVGKQDALGEELLWGWFFIMIGVISLVYTGLGRDEKEKNKDSLISDAIIGIVGTLTLIGLSALIIAASIDTRREKSGTTVLEKMLGTGSIYTRSGVSMSPAYEHISGLIFERKNDSISYRVPTSSGVILYPSGVFYTGASFDTQSLGEKTIVTSDVGAWIDGIIVDPRSSVELTGEAVVIGNAHSIDILTASTTKTYSGTSSQKGTLVVADGTNTLAWIAKTLSGYEIQKEGKKISESYPEISHLHISKSGYDTMALVRTESGERLIIKNGVPIETLREDYTEGSWKSNGSHSIYITDTDGIKRVVYDGVSIGKELSEVREIFLEKSGNTYAFFAREVGQDTYCVFTRFRGNLCGLSGYMNPRLGADGSSILYAGLKDGIWGIYRNTDAIVRDTGYTSLDISGDYAFFDITNPKQYLFIEKMSEGGYQLRKNGKIIPGVWQDVGLDVTFGYDNKAIMTAKDTSGWRVIEF